MGRLFWKIFLAFTAALLLILLGVAVLSAGLDRERHERNARRRALLPMLADEAGNVLARDGAEGLERWLGDAIVREGAFVYVLDSGRDLLGRKAPPLLPEPGPLPGSPRRGPHNDRPPRRPGPAALGGGQGAPAAPIPGGEGRFWLAVDLEAGRPGLFGSPQTVALWLVPALALGALAGFGLARNLSSPLVALQRTTRRFVEGRFDARVGPAMTQRGDEIGALGRDLDALAGRTGHLLASQRRLLRDLSHELRSPLARLQVALELARSRAGDTAGEEFDRMELETERLNELIGEILTLARLEASPERIDRDPLDLRDLLASVVDDARFEARSTGKSLDLEDGPSVRCRANDELLRRALENNLRNAMLHTPEGTRVDVTLERHGAEGVIRIRDRGPGVPDSALPHLFEPFYRLPAARTNHPAGHGIGLAIARRAVEAHGGSVSARNHPEGGLEIEIRVPAE